MTFLSTAAATAALVILGAGAQAATYDFGGLAHEAGEGVWDSTADGSYASGTFDNATDTYTVDGVSVTADGYQYILDDYGTDGVHLYYSVFHRDSYAYLDGPSGGDDGGLGVCAFIDGSRPMRS